MDRAKRFYESLGWRFDIDLVVSDDFRTVQFTPPHSACSIQFGRGRTTADPGSAQGMFLVVSDIEAARAVLSAAVSRSARWRFAGPRALRRQGVPTLRRRPSATRMATAGSFKRSPPGYPAAPGRTEVDVASLAALLQETAEHHGSFEAVAPPHDWWDWYGAYLDARQGGSTPSRPPRLPDATWPRSSTSSRPQRNRNGPSL